MDIMSIRSELKIKTRVLNERHGAKGAGEIACVPPMTCVANAIYNATAVRIKSLPLSPENVLRALKEKSNA
jgi:CO/xanthine dehydrogenase Mo-binding subunit